MSRPGRHELVLLTAILVAYVALFARTLDYELVWDDVRELQYNAAFDGPLVDGLTSTQTERTDADLTQLQDLELAYDSYRPLLFTSYWIDVQLWGRSARALHATNVVLGALSILVAWLVARRLLEGKLALLPVALFALHPAQIETIAYVSARGDLLAGLFALSASYAALRAFDPARPGTWGARAAWVAGAGVAFAASLLCKEAYVGLPIAIAGIAWARGVLRARWSIPATLLGVVIGYLVLRAAVVTATSRGALGAALVAMPGAWLEYVKIVVLPFDLSTERLHASGFTVPGWIVAGLAVAGLAARARARRAPSDPTGARPRDAAPPIGPAARTALAGVLWFAVLLGPSTVAILGTGIVADRYLYAPLFGIGWAIAAIGRRAVASRPELRRPLLGAAVLWGALLVVVGWVRVPVWSDNRTLYSHAVAMTPDSSSAHYRLAYLDAQAGRWSDAIPRLELAVQLDGRNLRALNNLGVGYLRTGQLAGAEDVLARAVDLNPGHFRSWLNLGLARLEQGKRGPGCAAIARALEINPRYEAAQQALRTRCSR